MVNLDCSNDRNAKDLAEIGIILSTQKANLKTKNQIKIKKILERNREAKQKIIDNIPSYMGLDYITTDTGVLYSINEYNVHILKVNIKDELTFSALVSTDMHEMLNKMLLFGYFTKQAQEIVEQVAKEIHSLVTDFFLYL